MIACYIIYYSVHPLNCELITLVMKTSRIFLYLSRKSSVFSVSNMRRDAIGTFEIADLK